VAKMLRILLLFFSFFAGFSYSKGRLQEAI